MRSLTPPDAWVGLAIDALPAAAREDVIVVLLIRAVDGNEQVVAATADQVVRAEDQLVVLGTRAAVRELQADAGEI
jgi:Trk K+ transport system NAD-binding subunit